MQELEKLAYMQDTQTRFEIAISRMILYFREDSASRFDSSSSMQRCSARFKFHNSNTEIWIPTVL